MSELHFLFSTSSQREIKKTFSLVTYTLQLPLALPWQFDLRSYYTVVPKKGGKEIDCKASPENITR